MDEKKIRRLKKLFDDFIHISENGEIEFWYARELQTLLGYSRWENFELVIKKAMISCENAGGNVNDHFRGITKMVCDFVGLKKIDHFAVIVNMVRNAGQLPQPFWLGAACGGGSRSAARCAARA